MEPEIISEIESEQKILDFASMANVELWAEHSSKQSVLIQKYGSKEKAMEQTLLLLFQAIKIALQKHPNET